MKLLTKDQQQSYENKEKFKNKYLRDKEIVQLEITVIMQENREVLRITYVI